MKKDPGFRLLGVGTERLKEQNKIDSKKAVIVPSTVKGYKDQVKAIMILDWDGELHTIAIDAPINMRQALTATYWAELASKMNDTFRRGLKDRA